MNDRLDAEMLRSVFDALPSLIFVVDEDVKIQEYNAAAAYTPIIFIGQINFKV
ncbi:MAG: PAS domain-containing protein [Desulfobacterales bacterium]|jgi:PAS domain-containing protein